MQAGFDDARFVLGHSDQQCAQRARGQTLEVEHALALLFGVLARQYAGETARLAEIEGLIAQHAKTRHDILVTAVYWRINEHVTAGLSRVSVAAPATVPVAAPVASKPVATAATAATPRPGYEPLHPEEVAAFKQALASVATTQPLSAPGEIVRSGRRNPEPPPAFVDTELDDRPSPLSGTQYGDL